MGGMEGISLGVLFFLAAVFLVTFAFFEAFFFVALAFFFVVVLAMVIRVGAYIRFSNVRIRRFWLAKPSIWESF